MADTPSPNSLDNLSGPEFADMLGEALQARQEQRVQQRPLRSSQGSGAASAGDTFALPGGELPAARAPAGALGADVISVSDTEELPPGAVGPPERSDLPHESPPSAAQMERRYTQLAALADYYARLSLWEDEANFVPPDQRTPPPALAPELRQLDAFARSVPLQDGVDAPRGGPLPNEATEALAARVRAACLERREELPEGLLADLDDYYQRLRSWEDEANFVPAHQRTAAPQVSQAVRDFGRTGLRTRRGGPDSPPTDSEAPTPPSPTFMAGVEAGIQAAQQEEDWATPEGSPIHGVSSQDTRPLFYSSPDGEVLVSGVPCYTDEQRGAGAADSSQGAGGCTDAAAPPLHTAEVVLPTQLGESDASRSERLSHLVNAAMRAAIGHTALHGPIPGLARMRPGAETPPTSGSSSEAELDW
eukprot:898928-Amphidinium_carterae.3